MQGPLEVGSWIDLRPARRDGITEYLIGDLIQPAGRIVSALALLALQNRQQLRRLDLVHRTLPQKREQVILQTLHDADGMALGPAGCLSCMPLQGDHPE